MSRESFSICNLLSLMLLLIHAATAQDLTVLSSSCQRHCGGLPIPYPFGIGKDCYLNNDKWYEVTCNNQVPFLSSVNRELVNISLPHDFRDPFGQIRFKNPNNEEFSLAFNVTGSPFFLTASNKEYETVELGWFIDTSHNMSVDSGVCYSIIEGQHGWSYSNFDACICEYGKYLERSYRSCWCNRGYRGNPYLSSGCTDINECEEAKAEGRNPCEKGHDCGNIAGNYECRKRKSKILVVILGVSLCFGLLVLAIGASWLCKFIIKQRVIKQKKRFFERNGGVLLQQLMISDDGNLEKARVSSSSNLEKANENLSVDHEFRQGGQGTEYKEMLIDESI